MLSYNKNLKQLSRNLRNNMTVAERLLWSKLRRKQLKGKQFYRQKIIGEYIVDFYSPESKIAIEVDGGQHYKPEGISKDKTRDHDIKRYGINVLRFSDREVLEDIEVVLGEIWNYL